MIKDNQRILNIIHILVDALLVGLAYLLAYPLRFRGLPALGIMIPEGGFLTFEKYVGYLVYIIIGYVAIYAASGLYTPRRTKRWIIEAVNLVKANALGILYFAFLIYIMKVSDFSRGLFVVFAIVNFIMDMLFRYVLSKTLRAFRKNGRNLKHVLIVGYSRAAEGFIDRIRSNPEWGYHICGILDDQMAVGTKYRSISIIGTMDSLEDTIEANDFDEVVLCIGIDEYARLEQLVAICEKTGIYTKFVPDYNSIVATNPFIEDLYGLPVINIRNVPLNNIVNGFVKRTMDIFGSILAIIIFGIPMIITAIAVKLSSPGPVIFRQTRTGRHGKEFEMFKFRSMCVQETEDESRGWTTKGDSRVTGVGRFIRKTSIDELPQLFNVLKGDMSLVGPRPERPQFVAKFKEEIPKYQVKHQVRPGMTGWAQINGYRGDTSIAKRIEHDLYYIENWTVGLDIKILFLTIFKGFINKNAY